MREKLTGGSFPDCGGTETLSKVDFVSGDPRSLVLQSLCSKVQLGSTALEGWGGMQMADGEFGAIAVCDAVTNMNPLERTPRYVSAGITALLRLSRQC